MNFSEERGVAGQDHAFLREVDLGVKFVDRHPILKVPVEAVGLLDEDYPNIGMRPQPSNHLAESGAAGQLCGFHVHIFLGNREPLGGCVVLQQLQLGRD